MTGHAADPTAGPGAVKASALGGVAWTSLSFGGQRVLQALVAVLLARILLPEDYGLVGLAQVTLTLIGLLRGTGVGAAIIHHKGPTPAMLSSVFWFGGAVGLASTAAVVLLSYPLALFLGEPRLAHVFLFFAPTFLLNAFTTVPGALLSRQRSYKRYAVRDLLTTVCSSAVALGMAYSGMGFYALIGGTVSRALFSIAFLWTATSWRPTLQFDWEALRPLLAYGLPLAWTNILVFLQRNLDNLLVGRFLGVPALGLYSFAYGILMSPVTAVQSVLGRVMFPEMARIREDLAHVRDVYLGSLRYIAAVLWLPLGGLLVLAPHFIPLVFGAQWRPAVLLVQVFCFIGVLQVIGTTVGWIYTSQGRTRQQLRVGLAASVPIYASFVIGLQWGLTGVALAYLAAQVVLFWPFNGYAFAQIGLRMRDVAAGLGRIALAFLEAVATLVIVRAALVEAGWHDALVCLAGAVAGTAVYALVLWLLEPDLVARLWRLPGELRRASRKGPGPPPSPPASGQPPAQGPAGAPASPLLPDTPDLV